MTQDQRAPEEDLSRRERQIMDVLLRHAQATASMVREEIPDPPSYDAVRTTLRILVEKGLVERAAGNGRHVYRPAIDLDTAREHAVSRLVRTFYQGSTARAALALLRRSDLDLGEEELERLERMLAQMDTAGEGEPA